MFDFTLILSFKQVLERLERAKEELEVKDSLLAELYVSHISQRQTIKTEYQVFSAKSIICSLGYFQVKRQALQQRHEEESVRMESDILKIKVFPCLHYSCVNFKL